MTAMEVMLKKIQEGVQQVLATQGDINGNKATPIGNTPANDAAETLLEKATQILAEKYIEEKEQGFKSEVVQTVTTPESGSVEMSVPESN